MLAPPPIRLRQATLVALFLFCILLGNSWNELEDCDYHGNHRQGSSRVVHFLLKDEVSRALNLTHNLGHNQGALHRKPGNHTHNLAHKQGKSRKAKPTKADSGEIGGNHGNKKMGGNFGNKKDIGAENLTVTVNTDPSMLTLEWGKKLSRNSLHSNLIKLEDTVKQPPARWVKLKGTRLPRVALVKQDVLADLYCPAETVTKPSEVVLSTMKHLGPMGFFDTEAFNTTFITLKTDRKKGVWAERATDCYTTKSADDIYGTRDGFTSMLGKRLSCTPKDLAKDEADIDWNEFDIVVSMDDAVSQEVTQAHPQVVWAYYITYDCMGSYKASLAAPLSGYDLFLTGNFNMRKPASLLPHAIEFPFTFARHGSMARVLELSKSKSKVQHREGILLSRGMPYTPEEEAALALAANQTTSHTRGSPLQLFKTLSHQKYFVYTTPDKIPTGNAVAEALAGGAVVIGCCIRNVEVLVLSGTYARELEGVQRLITNMEKDHGLFANTRDLQSRLFSYLGFSRPLYQLLDRGAQVLNSRLE